MAKRMNLRVFRASQDLSQLEMAEQIGVQRQYYSNVECGRLRGSAEFWDMLQKAFDIPDSEMYALMQEAKK